METNWRWTQAQDCYKALHKKIQGQTVQQQNTIRNIWNCKYQLNLWKHIAPIKAKSTSKQPLQQLFGSPKGEPRFAPVPLTERRVWSIDSSDRATHRASKNSIDAPSLRWFSRLRLVIVLLCCSAFAKACRQQTLILRFWMFFRGTWTGPEFQHHQSDSLWGRGWWGWCCAAKLQPKPAGRYVMLNSWGVELNWGFRLLDATLLASVGATKLRILLTLHELNYKAIVKRSMTQVWPNLLKCSHSCDKHFGHQIKKHCVKELKIIGRPQPTHKFHSTRY